PKMFISDANRYHGTRWTAPLGGGRHYFTEVQPRIVILFDYMTDPKFSSPTPSRRTRGTTLHGVVFDILRSQGQHRFRTQSYPMLAPKGVTAASAAQGSSSARRCRSSRPRTRRSCACGW